MKKALILLLVVALSMGTVAPASASDWDKAGKILTGIEGLRIVTGGNVDLIGSMFGIKNGHQEQRLVYHRQDQGKSRRHHGKHKKYTCLERVWVPHYVWETRYEPVREEYRPDCGRRVVMAAREVKYKVERGGHWEMIDRCG